MAFPKSGAARPTTIRVAPCFLKGGTPVMFSPQNKRFSILIIAIVVIVLGTVAGMVSMVNHDHSKDTVILTGFVGVLMAQLFSTIRAEQARRHSTKTQEEIKDQVQSAKEEIVQNAIVPALAASSPAQAMMPANVMELRGLIHTIVNEFSDEGEICKRLVEDSATAAASKAVAGMKDQIELCVKNAMDARK